MRARPRVQAFSYARRGGRERPFEPTRGTFQQSLSLWPPHPGHYNNRSAPRQLTRFNNRSTCTQPIPLVGRLVIQPVGQKTLIHQPASVGVYHYGPAAPTAMRNTAYKQVCVPLAVIAYTRRAVRYGA